MKKLNYLICGLILSIIPCLNVSAMEEIFYINQNGVEMTQDEYTQLLETYLDFEISALTQEQFDFEIQNNYTTVDLQTVYLQIDTKYDEFGNVEDSIETELTKEEYENGGRTIIQTRAYCDTNIYLYGCWETSHKKISMVYQLNADLSNPRIILNNQWKEMPSIRSYDVMGLRYAGTFTYSHWQGYQSYVLNGKTTTDYVIGNNNFVYANNGSMMAVKLPENKSITALSEKFIAYGSYESGTIYGSYQHARQNVTLDKAVNVSFTDGMGGVFKFNGYVDPTPYYDNTRGVYISVY